MPTILLIRHGENEYSSANRLAARLPDVHLNERGRQQARALADALQKREICAIFSSPLERAIETAQPLALGMQLPVQVLPGLLELDYGELAGQSMNDLRDTPLWKQVHQQPSEVTFPSGESFRDAQERMVITLEDLATRFGPKDVVACFTHGDPIRLALAHFLSMPLDEFHRLFVATAGLCQIDLNGTRPQVICINILYS